MREECTTAVREKNHARNAEMLKSYPVEILAKSGCGARWEVAMNDEVSQCPTQQYDRYVDKDEKLQVTCAALHGQGKRKRPSANERPCDNAH
jgi:hypothetical protein